MRLRSLTPEDKLRLAELQRQIAYTSAVGDLDGYSVNRPALAGPKHPWLDLNGGLQDPDAGSFVEASLEYLELIGCIEFHPKHENWVRIEPLSEAVDE